MDYEYPGWFGKHPYFPKTSRSGDTDVKLLHERVGALTTLWQSLEDQILQLASDILFTNIKLKTADVEFVLELLIGRVSGFSEKLRLIRDVNNLVFKNGSSTYSRIKEAAKRCQYAAELRNAIVHATAGVTKYQDGYEQALLHEASEGWIAPFPVRRQPTGCMTGIPRAVKRLRIEMRIWSSAV